MTRARGSTSVDFDGRPLDRGIVRFLRFLLERLRRRFAGKAKDIYTLW